MARSPFKGCDAETVFGQVTSHIASAQGKALWRRMVEEMKRNGVDAAISYLESDFKQVREHLSRELHRLESED